MQNAGILQLQQHGRPSGLKFDWRIRNEKESFGSAPYSEHDGSHAGRVRKQYIGRNGGRRKQCGRGVRHNGFPGGRSGDTSRTGRRGRKHRFYCDRADRVYLYFRRRG